MSKKLLAAAVLAVLAVVSAWAVGGQLPVEKVKVQRITQAELPMTVIEDGDIVSVSDTPGILRIGDGLTPGGVLVGRTNFNGILSGILTVTNRIDVKGPTNSTRFIRIWHDHDTANFSTASSPGAIAPLHFRVGTIQIAFTIATNRNVGIGTTTPSERLDVNGNAIVRSNLTVATITLGTNAPTANFPSATGGGIDAATAGQIASNVATSYGFAPTGSVQAIAGEAATNAVGHGLDDYYPVAYATSIAINPTNGYKQALYLAGTTTVSVAGGATNQMGSVRLDVWTGTNQHLFTNPVPAGTWSTSRVNIVQYIKTAFDTAWTARVFQW